MTSKVLYLFIINRMNSNISYGDCGKGYDEIASGYRLQYLELYLDKDKNDIDLLWIGYTEVTWECNCVALRDRPVTQLFICSP